MHMELKMSDYCYLSGNSEVAESGLNNCTWMLSEVDLMTGETLVI